MASESVSEIAPGGFPPVKALITSGSCHPCLLAATEAVTWA